jgi:hypothetical protein
MVLRAPSQISTADGASRQFEFTRLLKLALFRVKYRFIFWAEARIVRCPCAARMPDPQP